MKLLLLIYLLFISFFSMSSVTPRRNKRTLLPRKLDFIFILISKTEIFFNYYDKSYFIQFIIHYEIQITWLIIKIQQGKYKWKLLQFWTSYSDITVVHMEVVRLGSVKMIPQWSTDTVAIVLVGSTVSNICELMINRSWRIFNNDFF